MPENGSRILQSNNEIAVSPGKFLSPPEKETLKLMTPLYFSLIETIIQNKKVTLCYQDLSFLYDRSDIIKKSFISETNKFLPILCSFRYFGTTEVKELHLISARNSKSFFYRKRRYKKYNRLANCRRDWSWISNK